MSQARMQLAPEIGIGSPVRLGGRHTSLVQGMPAFGPTTNSRASLDLALRQVFPIQSEDIQNQKARAIMADEVSELSDAELDKHLTQFQSLIDGWLDEFEQSVFEGATLRQVLGGK